MALTIVQPEGPYTSVHLLYLCVCDISKTAGCLMTWSVSQGLMEQARHVWQQ